MNYGCENVLVQSFPKEPPHLTLWIALTIAICVLRLLKFLATGRKRLWNIVTKISTSQARQLEHCPLNILIMSCAVCNSGFGMMCRFSESLFIHPKCGADFRTDPNHQMLSTSGLKKRFGSKKAVLAAIASGKCRTAAGQFRFGNQSEMYLVAEFQVVMKEEEIRLNVGKKPTKPPKVNAYIQSVLDHNAGTSLEKLKELGHINDSMRIFVAGCAENVKRTCRAFKAGLLEVHPTKRAKVYRGKPVYRLVTKYKKPKKVKKEKKVKPTKVKAKTAGKKRSLSGTSTSPKKKLKT